MKSLDPDVIDDNQVDTMSFIRNGLVHEFALLYSSYGWYPPTTA